MIKSVSYRQGPIIIHLRSVVEDLAYVTASVADGSVDATHACEEAYGQIAHVLNREKMEIVHERVFGSLGVRLPVMEARRRAMEHSGTSENSPITYVQGRPLWGEGLAGVILQAVRPRQPGSVWTIYEGSVPCGRGWKRNGLTFLMLQDMRDLHDDTSSDNTRQMQAARMFERANRILKLQGAKYRDVVLTRIYISDILDWYGGFNFARTAKYGQFGLIPDQFAESGADWAYLPASTGIQGENPHGTACVMDLLALSTKSERRAEVIQMTNVRQEDAYKYGSAFSRGVCIRESDVTHIGISGTAAIDEQGKSLYPSDCRAQILRTIDNVEAVIAQEGASFRDICEATVFLKHAKDISVFRQVVAERRLPEMPVVCLQADICRDELLFEMDGTAALPPG